MIEDGDPADEDAVLMRDVFGLPDPKSVMSPVHIPRGFTKAYIAGEVVEDLGARDPRGPRQLRGDHDVLLIEGTGHAGVGAVIGLSNATVAAMLGAPAIIVSEGGVGRPIDEIVLNASLFAGYGVHVAGAIVNKVRLEVAAGHRRHPRRGLAPYGIPLLGSLPYRPILSNPTLGMILEGVHGETICPGPDLDRVIDGVAIGAMEPGHMLERVGPGTLVIVPGDREDVILALDAVGRRRPRGAPRRRPRPDRRLPAATADGRCHQRRGPVRDPRRGGHLRRCVGGPRPAGEDALLRPREDRADQGACRGEPRHRPDPRRRGAGRSITGRAEPEAECGRVLLADALVVDEPDLPNRTAVESTAGPTTSSTSSSSRRGSSDATLTYSGIASGSLDRTAHIVSRSASADRSPPRYTDAGEERPVDDRRGGARIRCEQRVA